MSGRILEISQNGRSLHLERGFIAIREDGKALGRVPIDDIDAVIASAHGITWSNKALSALSAQGSPVVILGENFHPASIIMPISGHHDQGRRMRAQAGAKLPLRKRLWADLVRAKIKAQSAALEQIGLSTTRLDIIRSEVRSGDTSNREAAAAQAYWPAIMANKFHRNDSTNPANGMLNYGYAVLRASTARAIVAAGLHPSLSVHHVSDGDAFALADDLMEPFRPTVDLVVRDLVKTGLTMEAPETRPRLVSTLNADFRTQNGRTPLSHCLVRLAQSLSDAFSQSAGHLNLPQTSLPLPAELDL